MSEGNLRQKIRRPYRSKFRICFQ